MAIKVLMPALSPTMKRGKIAKWNIEVGSRIGIGYVVAEIETDKATMEFETVDEGIVGAILVQEGQEVTVGEPIAWILEDEDDRIPEAELEREQKHEAPQVEEVEVQAGLVANVTNNHDHASPQVLGKNSISTPAARARAKELGVTIDEIRHSVHKKIKEKDVVEYVASRSATSKDAARHTSVVEAQSMDMSQMQRVIAQRMTEAKTTVPHFYMESIVCVDKLLEVQKLCRDKGWKLTLTHCFISCIAKSIKAVPGMNVSWDNGKVRTNQSIDVAVAVALEGDGLITPIVRDADKFGLTHLVDQVKELVEKAKSNKLRPEEFQGGSVTLSNLGMYGVDSFYPIMNLPQASIIGVGKTRQELYMSGGQIRERTICSLTISVDHRVINGATAARFMQHLRESIEDPYLLLM